MEGKSEGREAISLGEGLMRLFSNSPTYDDEPEYDPDEPAEPDVETAHVDDLDIGENPDQLLTTGDASRGVVESGDITAANRSKGTPKNKKIAAADRKTTPYLTKYERARILGTRALQIRWAFSTSTGGKRSCFADYLLF